MKGFFKTLRDSYQVGSVYDGSKVVETFYKGLNDPFVRLEDGRIIDIHQELILNKMAEAVRDHFRIKKEEKKIKQDEIKMHEDFAQWLNDFKPTDTTYSKVPEGKFVPLAHYEVAMKKIGELRDIIENKAELINHLSNIVDAHGPMIARIKDENKNKSKEIERLKKLVEAWKDAEAGWKEQEAIFETRIKFLNKRLTNINQELNQEPCQQNKKKVEK